jgi:hypothetical protein
MLRLMLDHHSQICCFGEFEFAVSEAVGDDWPDVTAFRHWAVTDRMFSDYHLIVDPTLSYPDLIHSFLAQIAERTSKPVVSAAVHTRFDLLPRLWPKARFIHILRDPRDVARSTIGMGWTGHAYFGAPYWVEPEQRWDALSWLDPSQRFEVRYEELVNDPEAELTRMCSFLGLSYEPSMLAYDRVSTYSKPDPKLAGQWKGKMSSRDAALVDYACGELLERRGYRPSGAPAAPPGLGEMLRLHAIHRVNKARFAIQRLGPSLWARRFLSTRIGTTEWRQRVKLEANAVQRRYLK